MSFISFPAFFELWCFRQGYTRLLNYSLLLVRLNVFLFSFCFNVTFKNKFKQTLKNSSTLLNHLQTFQIFVLFSFFLFIFSFSLLFSFFFSFFFFFFLNFQAEPSSSHKFQQLLISRLKTIAHTEG